MTVHQFLPLMLLVFLSIAVVTSILEDGKKVKQKIRKKEVN